MKLQKYIRYYFLGVIIFYIRLNIWENSDILVSPRAKNRGMVVVG